MLAGRIVSLVLLGVALVLVMIFFTQKKSPILMSIFSLELILLATMQILAWYVDSSFSFGVTVMTIIALISGVIAITVYQNYFKTLFMKLSKTHKKLPDYNISDEELRESIQAIVNASQTMAKSRTGALIVIVKNKIDQYILESGVKLDAIVSAPLLESIFNTKCPMHDGAVIVKGTKILTAGSFLPLSKSDSIAKDLGTRHRAGIGVTEAEGSDVISIIISEENGIISTAVDGVLRRYLTPERLFDFLYDSYKLTNSDSKNKKTKKIL